MATERDQGHGGPRNQARPTLSLCAVTLMLCLASANPFAQGKLPVLHPLDAKGRVTYFIADGTMGSSFLPGDRDLATWALRQWERAVDGALHFEPSAENDAEVRVFWVPAGDGRYGEMRAFQSGTLRGAAVFIRPDTTALAPPIANAARQDALMRDTVVYLTCLHELGHALGLEHTSAFADIMYFFGYGGDIFGFFNRYRLQLHTRSDIAMTSGLSPSDISRVRALYKK
jgi:matrixin